MVKREEKNKSKKGKKKILKDTRKNVSAINKKKEKEYKKEKK